MSYFRTQDLRTYAGDRSDFAAGDILTKSRSDAGHFDIFLSHSILDARTVLGIREMLKRQGLTVYVDWIDDPLLTRSAVSAQTADRLCQRMKMCGNLIYATSRASRKSRWMPWELGYFDALKGRNRVLLMPIEDSGRGEFDGAEYLGLYRSVQRFSGLLPYVTTVGSATVTPLNAYIRAPH